MSERIVRYTREELKELKGRTDFARIDATTDADIEEQVKNDPDLVIPTDKELREFRPAKHRSDRK